MYESLEVEKNLVHLQCIEPKFVGPPDRSLVLMWWGSYILRAL